jgi:hypothetical protein
MTRTIHIEDLLERGVVDRQGRDLGRIQEIVAEKPGHQFRVSEYRLGSGAVVRGDQLVITRGSAPCIVEGNGKASD